MELKSALNGYVLSMILYEEENNVTDLLCYPIVPCCNVYSSVVMIMKTGMNQICMYMPHTVHQFTNYEY